MRAIVLREFSLFDARAREYQMTSNLARHGSSDSS
jgi:hypothetical protein